MKARAGLLLALCFTFVVVPDNALSDGAEKELSALLAQAEEAHRSGDFDRAETLYRELVRRGGEKHARGLARVRHSRWAARARKAREAGQLEQALRHFKRALSEWPAIESERELFAIELQLRAQRLESDFSRRANELELLGDEHLGAGRLAEAVDAYQRALQMSPGQEGVKEKLARTQLAHVKRIEEREVAQALKKARVAFAAKRWQDASEAYAVAAATARLALEDLQRQRQAQRFLAIAAMVKIPAGEVWVGSRHAPDEAPKRRLRLPAFYIDRDEVSNAEYFRFVQSSGHRAPPSWSGSRPPAGQERFPVSGVSWHDALAYARWAGKRLPTESEWTRAARGDLDQLFPWGQFFKAGLCNALEQGNNGPTAIGSYQNGASPFGVNDLLGNMLEWTSSRDEPYPGGRWLPPRTAHYVLRGGAWFFPAESLRIGVRYHDDPRSKVAGYGFRCAMDLE